MSDFSLILVLQIKTSKIFNDMANVSIKSEKITSFGGIFHVMEQFDRHICTVIDSVLGLRCTTFGYLACHHKVNSLSMCGISRLTR